MLGQYFREDMVLGQNDHERLNGY